MFDLKINISERLNTPKANKLLYSCDLQKLLANPL